MKKRWLYLLILICFPLFLQGKDTTFYTLNTRDGLSDNCILQMMQLEDGRILTYTEAKLNIYDGRQFTTIDKAEAEWMPLESYRGFAHLYADRQQRIWVKEYKRLACFSLPEGKPIPVPHEDAATDFYIDSYHKDIWWITPQGAVCKERGKTVRPVVSCGALQDLEASGDTLFFFYDSGCISAHSIEADSLLYQTVTYPPEDAHKFRSTSLVVRDIDGSFLQVRMGDGHSGFFRFHPQTGQCRQLLETKEPIHTLAVTPSRTAYLTTNEGYITYHLPTGHVSHSPSLRLPDGTLLTTGINTVCPDREGGIWLGTYDRGILYTSPLAGLFDTQRIDIRIQPILSAIYLHGEQLQTGKAYRGKVLLEKTAPYVSDIDFAYDQNNIAFLFTTMNYVSPRQTCYKYRLTGGSDEQWHIATADSPLPLVDNHGALYLPLTGLQPGNYTLEVTASTHPQLWENAKTHLIRFRILPPWWATPLAFLCYILIGMTVCLCVAWLYSRQVKRRMERQAREEKLMMRIQELVAQSQTHHQELNVILTEPSAPAEEEPAAQSWTPQEIAFMNKATMLVEQNLSNTGYSVEQLAKDLCIERTGLYKKLTALMQKSPVAFIRNIRLQRAAELLAEGRQSITDIAEQTGFSSVSYFSKCFQQQYGYRPSDYKR